MRQIKKIKITFISALLASTFISTPSFGVSETNRANHKIFAAITPQIFEKAKKNENWKLALTTGKEAQVVLMNITPKTNPNNEIGLETHKFDQVIFMVEGQAKAILNDKNSIVKGGDMIFIPQGTPHNFINLNAKKPLKIISIYSATDIPENSVYKKKSDTPPN